MPVLSSIPFLMIFTCAVVVKQQQLTIKKKIRQTITDPGRIHLTDPGNPDICNVYAFYRLYKDHDIAEIEERCRKGKIGCTECKDEISSTIYKSLESFQEKRRELEKNMDKIYQVLEEGKRNVRSIASRSISVVRRKMGID